MFLVIAWLMSKKRLFISLMQVMVRLPHKLLCYVTFSIFCIMGTYLGLHIEDSIANTCAIGTVMDGLMVLNCMIFHCRRATGGLVHSVLIRHGCPDKVFSPLTVGATTFVAELVQMLIILLIARPFGSALHLVSNIVAPMMVTNTFGAALFMRILFDKRTMFENIPWYFLLR